MSRQWTIWTCPVCGVVTGNGQRHNVGCLGIAEPVEVVEQHHDSHISTEGPNAHDIEQARKLIACGVGCSCGADNIPGSVHASYCDDLGDGGQSCRDCDGTGHLEHIDGMPYRCPACGGTGNDDD